MLFSVLSIVSLPLEDVVPTSVFCFGIFRWFTTDRSCGVDWENEAEIQINHILFVMTNENFYRVDLHAGALLGTLYELT